MLVALALGCCGSVPAAAVGNGCAATAAAAAAVCCCCTRLRPPAPARGTSATSFGCCCPLLRRRAGCCAALSVATVTLGVSCCMSTRWGVVLPTAVAARLHVRAANLMLCSCVSELKEARLFRALRPRLCVGARTRVCRTQRPPSDSWTVKSSQCCASAAAVSIIP